MHEAQVLRQVLAEIGETAEWNAMPETAATPALEQSLAHHQRDRAIRRSVVHELEPRGVHEPEALKSSRFRALHVRRDAGIRPGVDQRPAGCENPVNLAQGIDHARSRDSSKRPREDHHVEGRVWIRQMLRRAGRESHVSNAGLARVPFGGSNRVRIRIDTVNTLTQRRAAQPPGPTRRWPRFCEPPTMK